MFTAYTKDQEYKRSAEMINEIAMKYDSESRPYFILAFLYDSQYTKEDLKKIMELCKPEKVTLSKTS